MEDFTIFIVLGLYWLFSAIKNSSKNKGKDARPRKSILGSLGERMQEAQRVAEEKLADWEEEQRQLQGAKAQSEEDEALPSLPVRSRAEVPERVRREARAVSRQTAEPEWLRRPDSPPEMQRRLGIEKARRVAAERDRDEALAWIRRLEEGVASVGDALPESAAAAFASDQAMAYAPDSARRSDPARVERRQLPGLTKALERLSPLRRAILYAEITGAPASLRPDVGGLGRAEH